MFYFLGNQFFKKCEHAEKEGWAEVHDGILDDDAKPAPVLDIGYLDETDEALWKVTAP